MADERGTHIGRIEEEPAEESFASRASHPADPGRADDDLDVGAGLVQQDRGLDRALTRSDDRHAAAGEAPEIGVLAGVACELRRKAVELRGPPREFGDPRGDDDAVALDWLIVFKDDAETGFIPRHRYHLARVDLRDGVRLEPLAVRDEVRERDRPADRPSSDPLELLERVRARRVRDARRAPAALEAHPPGHVPLPKRHGPAKDADLGAG